MTTWDVDVASPTRVTTSSTALTEPGSSGLVRVLGGPGTGKSTLLADIAAQHIEAGAEPESVLLLTGSARMRAQSRAAITARLLSSAPEGRTVVSEPLVRTVHSYAFAVLRLAAQRNGDPPPRLITSAEQDAIIGEMLAGDVDDGDRSTTDWPPHLRPALTTAGFATELRDLIARCTERGVDPIALQRLGRSAGRPEWSAAGRFAQAYEQIMLLRSAVGTAAPQATVPALGAAELVSVALEALAVDDELLAAERGRIRLLLVDDAQQLDPQAARLVRLIAAGAELAVLAGDPDQAVFGYRGADPALLQPDGGARTVSLSRSHRCSPAVARAVAGIAQRLPSAGPARRLTGVGTQSGSVTVGITASPHAESALIADTLRRAHLIDHVPWSEMAVIVRSVPRAGAALARALATAGVPVELPPGDLALAHEPAARALLNALAAVADGLDGETALSLLTGPLGRVDPVSLRQLRRALRRADGSVPPRDFNDLLVEALETGPPQLPAGTARPLRRLSALLEAARRSHSDGEDPRIALWQVWHRSGLERRWLAASGRGGVVGAQADHNLDMVTALFDAADHYVGRTDGASLRGLLGHLEALTLPATARDHEPRPDAVAVLSAHAALGREFDVVVIAGLQEGLWPNIVPRGGVLGTQRLVDVLDGIPQRGAAVSAKAPLLAEERRLLIAAMGRARSRLLVTAVDSDSDESLLPSSFCAELTLLTTGLATGSAPSDSTPVRAPRVLGASALVGRLRAVVCSPESAVDDDVRYCAAAQLARLADAAVPGADPDQWYGMTPLSTDEPLRPGDDRVVTLSPSTLQTLVDCPLRWLLERHGGAAGRDVRSAVGSLLHAVVSGPASTSSEMQDELDRYWSALPFGPEWHSHNELIRHRAMLEAFTQWCERTRSEFTEVGTEIEVEGTLAPSDGSLPGVALRGRLDRLERDEAGRSVVVDIKTSRSPVSRDAAQRHAQLAMYQLAVTAGLLSADSAGGARLVYLGRTGATGPTEREQDPITAETAEQWRDVIRQAAAATQGPQFIARVNDSCTHCPVRSVCPAQNRTGSQWS